MAYVIAEPCIGTKDTACVDACPVDCIHPKKDEGDHGEAVQLFIDPVECIDCGACVPGSARCRRSMRVTTCRRSGRSTRRRMLRISGVRILRLAARGPMGAARFAFWRRRAA